LEEGVPRSRTRKKQDAQEIDELAGELMALSAEDIRALPVQEDLKLIIAEGHGITAYGARKRHRKYLARNLRGPFAELLEPLRAHMASRHGSRQAEVQREKYLSGLRDRLLLPDSCSRALEELAERFPDADLNGLRFLVQKNLKTPQRRYGREIYRLVVSIWQRNTRQAARVEHERNS